MFPSKVIGIAINGRKFSKAEVDLERERVKDEFNLPACDVMKHGAAELAEAILELEIKNR